MKFAVSLHMERYSPQTPMSEVMANVLALARMADQGGFETLWAPEHHTIECTISPNPFTTLTWLGQHTERIRLGTATLAAAYWSPIRLARRSAAVYRATARGPRPTARDSSPCPLSASVSAALSPSPRLRVRACASRSPACS